MLKTVVMCALLWHEMFEFSSRAVEQCLTNTPVLNFPTFTPPKINDTNVQIEAKVNYNGNAAPQIFYVNGPLFGTADLGLNLSSITNVPRPDYVVTNGIGAHKVHRHMLKWTKARQFCIDEGGHLAVIRSELEERTVQRMMTEHSVVDAWIGFHDLFEEGDWVSVFDEPLGQNGWARWSARSARNSDNIRNAQNCAQLRVDGSGMDPYSCDAALPFICKISNN